MPEADNDQQEVQADGSASKGLDPAASLIPVGAGVPVAQNIDQTRARAGRDLIGRDQVVNQISGGVFHFGPQGGKIAQLLDRLKTEFECNEQAAACFAELEYFYKRHALDGIEGLEAKFDASGQSTKLYWALERKEQFVKVLEKWSLYASAQEIFAHLLCKAYYEFGERVLPQLGNITPEEISKIFDTRFVEPAVNECGAGVMPMNHNIAVGMIYWLADQCFIRWHK